jgi:hypothetical protein
VFITSTSIGSLSVAQQVTIDVIAPPILTTLWWLFSNGWSYTIQRGNPTPRTKAWLSKGFWGLLAFLYLLMFGITLFAHL